jgi:hypothetical protein
MSIDEQLTGALRDAAGPLPDDVGSWCEVQRRGRKARGRRAGRAGVAVLTLLALGAGAFVATRDHDADHSVITRPPAPGELLARVRQDGVAKLVVLSAADGRVLREVSADSSLGTFGGVSASVTGTTAYVTVGESDPDTATCSSDIKQAPVVASVDVRTGRVSPLIKSSASPVVSPDGRWLAYMTGTNSCAAPSSQSPTIGLTDLATGANTRPLEGDEPERAIQPLAWAPDASKVIAKGARVETGDPITDQLVVLLDRFPLGGDVQELAVPKRFETATFLPDGRLVVAYLRGGLHHVAVADENGRPTEVLFTSDEPGALNPCCGEGLAVDASGRIALMFDRVPNRPRRGGIVQVWTPGEAEPRTVVPATSTLQVEGVAWLAASATSSTSTTGRVGVVGPDGSIVGYVDAQALTPSGPRDPAVTMRKLEPVITEDGRLVGYWTAFGFLDLATANESTFDFDAWIDSQIRANGERAAALE